MNRFFLLPVVLLALCVCAQAQQSSFTPNCAGVDDTSKFTSLISSIGANNGTISLPWKNGTRCAVNNLVIPGNIALDNEIGTGIKVNAGQVLTVLGPVINPVGKLMFFGPGSTSFVGNVFVGSNGQSLTSDGQGGVSWTTITSGGGGPSAGVLTFAGRDGAVLPATGDYTWAQINKAISSLGDITLRSADLLSNGTTGTGTVVLNDSPTLISPVLTGATISSVNGLTITPSTGTLTIANGKTLAVSNSLSLAGTGDGFTLTVPATGTAVLTSRTITEGAGLAGNTYDLSANRTLALGTPSTLSVSSLTSVSGTTHSHAITSSSNPGAAASILASNGSGHLQLVRLGVATAPTQPLEVGGNVFINAATANLFMKDINTGWQSASTTIVTPQVNNSIRSTAFTSGVNGWNINAVGDAEFNNVRVRGEIAASVFKVSEITASAGTLGVFKSASNLVADTTSPSISGTDDFIAENSDLGAALFAVGDRLRFKGFTGAGVADVWYTVNSVTNNGATSTYNATMQSGSSGVSLPAGMAIVDYGPAGTGFITLSTDGTVGSSPNMTMATHTGSPWSTSITLLRAGNLKDSYGYASDIYGWATGQHGVAGQSWITVEQTNGVRIGNNTDVLAQVTTAGDFISGRVAAGQPNTLISAGQLRIRNNTTTRILLDTDGSGFLANNLFSWDTSGNVTILGNASIANWTVNSTSLARDTGTNATSSGMAPADFPFFAGATVANRATAPFRVTPAGSLIATNASITGDITANTITASSGTIADWSILSGRFSNGTTHLASNFDIPAGAAAWLGRSTTGYQGVYLSDGTRFISTIVGDSANSSWPYSVFNDGTRIRIALGALNRAWGSDGSTNSMGMKIWASDGAKLVEFSDVQNTIAGLNITTTRASVGSGTATAGLDSTATGGDDVRIFAGNATPSSAPFRVTEAGVLTASNANITGAVTATSGSLSNLSISGLLTVSGGSLVAGGSASTGIVTLDSNGLAITIDSNSFQSAGSIKHKTSGGIQLSEFWDEIDTSLHTKRSVWWSKSVTTGGNYDSNIRILAQAPSASTNGASITLDVSGPGGSSTAGSTVNITRDYIALYSLNQLPNIGLNTTTFGSSAVGVIGIGNATTTPTSSPANMVQIYSEAGELKVRDAANNITLLSPHESGTDKWIFYSCNAVTNRCIKVDMEKLVQTVERLSGETLKQEWKQQ